MNKQRWLLLLYALPSTKSSERVGLWRKLKKFGALPLKTSAYLLPDTPSHFERFQWLSQQICDGGGDATLIRVSEIENLNADDIIRLFNEARAADYSELLSAITAFLKRKGRDDAFTAEVEKFRARYSEIREIDFFDAPRAHDVETLLRRAENMGRGEKRRAPRLAAKQYGGRTWMTRPQPEIDRAGSAWLIRKFVDREATFVFSSALKKFPKAIPFDMLDVEFTHKGDDCTFETLLKRFGIEDKAVRKLAEMIHDADLEDDKFHRPECVGIDRMLKGWAKLGLKDEEILAKGLECFDALYATLQRG